VAYQRISHANRVLHNLCTDIWTAHLDGLLRFEIHGRGTTGSSTMPHKIQPDPVSKTPGGADLELSSAQLLDSPLATLVTSRLPARSHRLPQRRGDGRPPGHSVVALDSIQRGLGGDRRHPLALPKISTPTGNSW
jgi:adenylosuccinate lyase